MASSVVWELIGWGLFIVAGLIYCADALLGGAPLYFAGSVTWTCGCVAFLVPLLGPVLRARWAGDAELQVREVKD